VVDLGKRRAGPLQKPTPCLREPDPGRVSLEQGYAQFVLKSANTAADRGLLDTENLRCAAETQMLGDQKRLSDGNEVNHSSASNVTLARERNVGRVAQVLRQKGGAYFPAQRQKIQTQFNSPPESVNMECRIHNQRFYMLPSTFMAAVFGSP
jgi:hypothetical protein